MYNYYNQMQYPYMQQYNGYQSVQPKQNVMQPQTEETPFVNVRYGTIDEIKGQLVGVGQSIMFINRNLGEFYVKSANQMGEPLIETFKYYKVDNNAPKQDLDTSQFVNKEALSNYITKDDLQGIVAEIEEIKQKIEVK